MKQHLFSNYDEFEKLQTALKKEMPIFTENFASLPFKKFGFPKNWMDEAVKVNEKFLDNWQSKIEQHFSKNQLGLFSIYQNRYFSKHHESSNWKESIFKKCECKTQKQIIDIIMQSMLDNGFLRNSEINSITGFMKSTKFLLSNMNTAAYRDAVCSGATLTGGADQTTNGDATGNILASKLSSGTIGQCYNRCRVSQTSGTGYNYKMAIYDDSSTTPNNLEVNTGSIAGANSTYNFESLTQFNLTTAQNWLGIKSDNASWSFRTANNTLANERKFDNHGTFDFSDPWSNVASDGYPHFCELGSV